MINIPTFETERLILRGWRESDLDAFALLMADEQVTCYVGGVMSRQEAWRYIAYMLGHWTLRGFGQWAVTRKSDGVLLGRVGFINPEGWPGIEVGWVLARPFWGHGYATEAARVAVRYGFETLGLPKLISLIHPDNRNSQRVAERLGETKAGPTTIFFGGKSHEAEVWEVGREND